MSWLSRSMQVMWCLYAHTLHKVTSTIYTATQTGGHLSVAGKCIKRKECLWNSHSNMFPLFWHFVLLMTFNLYNLIWFLSSFIFFIHDLSILPKTPPYPCKRQHKTSFCKAIHLIFSLFWAKLINIEVDTRYIVLKDSNKKVLSVYLNVKCETKPDFYFLVMWYFLFNLNFKWTECGSHIELHVQMQWFSRLLRTLFMLLLEIWDNREK